MKVLKRDQVTEVVTRRTVFHSLEYKGERYSRTLNSKTETPFMDENIIVHKPKLKWLIVENGNVLSAISNELAKELENEYQALSIREKNGDI
jgi:hypothetical protein